MAGRKKNVNDRVKKQPSNNQWFQNAAKSLGFTSAEIVKDLMPNTAEFVDWNKSDTMDLLKSMRTNSSSRNMVNKQFKNIPQIKAASDILKNAKEDILSGNFNNKDREFEFDDMDFNFGDILDDNENKDMFIEEEKNNPTIIDTMPLAKVINSGNEAAIETMINVAEQQMAVESEKIMFNHKSTTAILGGLNAINDNLATLVRFNAESTAKYHAASLKFYEDTLNFLKESNKNVKSPDEMDDLNIGNDLFTSRGGVKLKEYKNIIKKNIDDMHEKNPVGSSMMSMLSNPLFYKQLAKNPIGMLSRVMATELMPAATKTAMKAIDESISSVLPSIMAKINTFDGDENPLYNYLFKVLGSKAKLDYKVDLGKYEKGAISWDGESKKALVEVIPAYLRRIESALTGQEERIYNYDSGKFTDMKNLKKDYQKKLRQRETYGYGDLRNKALDVAHGMGASQDIIDQFEQDMDELLSAMTKKGSRINPLLYKNKDGEVVDELFDEMLFDFDPNRREFVRKVFGGLSKNDLLKMASSGIDESRRETQRYLEDIRKNTNLSGHNLLYSEDDIKAVYKPSAGGLMGQKDKFGLSQLDYLRDIRSALINGIRVFPDQQKRYKGWQPNIGIVKKEREENNEYNRRLHRERQEAESTSEARDLDYSNLLNMSDEEVRKIYEEKNDISNKQYSGTLGQALNKVNNTVRGVASKIEDKAFNMLFGDEKELPANLQERLAGVAPGDSKGLFASLKGFFQDSLKSTAAYFTGQAYTTSDGTVVEANPDSFLNKMKSFFSGSIDKLSSGEEGGLLGKISKDFMDGFNQFKVNLFGEKALDGQQSQETLKELTAKIKSRLPKAVGMGLGSAMVKTFAASQLGILGSVLLPGGPIGAALVGTTFGFLKQSETFNKWMFGDVDEDGNRMGGVISKEFQDKFKENKGMLGKAAGVGVLSSIVLGPVAGSLLGIGTAMTTKNEAFQEFLYGKDYKEKDKKSLMDGAFGKVYKSMMGKDSNPKLATFLGAGGIGVGLAQGIGFLPSFLLPGGPIMGSMLGLAAGITASSDKFQEFLFGEKDVDGKRYGGLMTKFTNWMDTSLLQPLKIKAQEINDKLYGFLRKNVFDPITSAFEPIKQAGKFMIEDIKDSIKESFTKVTEPVVSSFREHVTKPLGKALKTALINPLKSLVKGMFSMVGKLAGSIITSPIKAISLLGNMAEGYNEKRVIEKEQKRRRDEYNKDIEENGMTIGKFFKGFNVEKISKQEKEELLNKELSYRQGKTRKERQKEQKQALKDEMTKRAEKRAEMQKQFEEDKAFGKASGWKYASKSQKEKREQELKEKEAWLQERMATQSEETGEKVSKMSGVVEKVSEYTEGTVDVLKDIHGLLKDNLKALGKKTGMSDVIDELRDRGQSHEDGLDEVPKDGYVAELHKGEMVVPQKPAGVLRSIFGGGASIISKMMSDEAKDRNDNALGLTDEEAEQQKEIKDQSRYSKVSRKSVDFLQNQLAAKKKEKEEKKWKDDILSAIHGVGNKVSAGAATTAGLFDKIKDLFSKIPNFLGNLPSSIANGIGSIIKGLGIGGSLATIAGVLMGKWHDYQDSEEYMLSRTDKDGYQITDDANLEIGKKMLTTGTRKAFMKPIKVAKEKIVDPIIDGGKAVVKGVKNTGSKIKQGITKTATKFDDYINPKKVGKTALGETYSYTMDKSARKGFAKPLGAAADAVKSGKNKVTAIATAGKEKASTIVSKFIGVAKKALDLLRGKLAEKFPKIAKFASKCDNIFAKMLKNCDGLVKKFGKKISGFLTSSALKSNPVGVALDAVLAVGDFISGLTAGNAGNLFGVAKQNVDGKMRGITAVLQTVCNFSWMGVIWIINEITNSMFGINFIRTLAIWIYNAIPGDTIDTNDTDISNCDSIESALTTLGVPESHIHFFQDNGEWKDFSKAKNTEFHGTISAAEQMELARLQYNLKHGTSLDKDAWIDKESQTLGGKVLDTISKPFKKTNKEKQAKYAKKMDKYSKKVDKYEEKVENSGNFITKGWNKMLLNYNKKKLDKYTDKHTKITNVINKNVGTKDTEKAKATDYVNKNAATAAEKDAAMSSYEAQLRAEFERQGVVLGDSSQMTGDAGMGEGEEKDPYGVKQAKKIEKEAKTPENKTLAKALTKSGQTVIKNMKNYTNIIGKGLKFNIGLVSKTYNAAQEGLSKVAKKTSKDMNKDTEKTTKELTTENKGLLTAVKNSFGKVKEKVQSITGSLSNIQIGSISLGDIGDSLTTGVKSVVEKVFGWLGLGNEEESTSSTTKKSSTDSNNENWLTKAGNKVKSWFNFGSAGTETRTKSARESGYIQPSNTTNNTSNTNNKFVFYSQSDARWGNNRIGGTRKNMTEAGCGPTSLAMAISQMTGEEITPDVIARLGKDYLPGYSEYKLFPEVAKKFGMNYFDTADATEIMDSLKSGKPVILSGKSEGPGMTPYTKEGHIVVANSVDGNRVFINDPRGKEFSGYYDINTVMSGLNRGMVLSPSAQMNVNKYSKGKVEGWRNPLDENPNRIPLLYGDSEFTNMQENLGGAPGQVRVADRVLSYARAFLANTSKFKYSQAQSKTTGRHGIDNNNIGADCSSFVSHVLSVAGDTGKIAYLSQSFWDQAGYKVDEPQIGDVVCQEGHVGLYSGDGKYIHMSGRKDGIKESKAIQRGNNRHRGYKRVLKNPDAMVDATITGGNSLLGTVVATESGNPVTSGGGTIGGTDGTTGSIAGSQSSGVDQMGVFGKLGNIANNLMASIFNGKEVDMYATSAEPTATPGTAPGGTVDISGSPNTRRAVWDFFTGMGYSKEATAGIMGNFQQESGIDPKVIQGGGKGPAAGIAQWENYNKKSARWADLNKYAQSKGKDWTDLQTQLEFVHKELEGSAPDTYTASLLKKRGGIEKLKSLTNVKDAVHMFEETFERAGKPMWENRYKYANSIYNEFAGSGNAGAGGYATATSAESAPSDGSIPSSMNGWSYYKQGDPKWQEDISGKKIGPSGCGMASHAMMLTTMFGKEVTPVTVGKWARANGHWSNGMGWNMPPSVAKLFGLEMPLSVTKDGGASSTDLDKVKAEIKANRPVVLSGRGKKGSKSPFTGGGHIVLAVGVDGNNRLIINDPRGPEYTRAYEDSEVMDIGVGLRGAWSFEKTGSSSIPSDWTTGADFTATPGSSLSITGDTSSAVAPSVDQMGVFAKMGNIANNLMASIFNGKQVDMYAADTATTDTSNNSGGTTPTGDATWNGTQYDLSKYNMSDLSEKKQNHINKIIQPALHTYKTHNLLPSVTIAQSVGESGWGPSSGLATKGNNLFGIKCGSKWTGKAYTAKTGEFLNGKNVTITDSFRAYDSMADSVIDRANFLSASRYKAMMTKNTAQEQFQAMKDGGYATDPNYVSKMMKIVNDSKLTRFDTPKPPVEASGAATTPSGDAGKGEGDGKTYMVQPSKAKHTGNTTALTGADKAAYANAKRAIDKLDRQISTVMNNQNATPTITGEYVDVLAAIVEQLQAINSNTANTARGISNIEIVSANEPISSGGKPAVNTRKPIDTRQANGNTGYDIARKMASYK